VNLKEAKHTIIGTKKAYISAVTLATVVWQAGNPIFELW